MLNAEKADPFSRVTNAPPGDPRPQGYAKSPAEQAQRPQEPHAQHWLGLLRFVMSLPPQVRDLLLRQWFAPSPPGRIAPRNEP